jgi:hypothetical protein
MADVDVSSVEKAEIVARAAKQLLGLDVGTTLEVTEAFPFPVRGGDMTPMGLGIDRVF